MEFAGYYLQYEGRPLSMLSVSKAVEVTVQLGQGLKLKLMLWT